MKVLITTSKATSLMNVAKDIAYVLIKKRHTPRILTYVDEVTSIGDICDAVVMVYPTSPLFCVPYFLFYRDFKVHVGKPIIFYTTIEGRPAKRHLASWIVRDLEFVAVSHYVYDKLTEAGLSVIDIVHHGIIHEQIKRAEKLVPTVKRYLSQIHGKKVVFGAIAFHHIRKGLYNLKTAVEILSEKRDDFIVHLVTNMGGKRALEGTPNMHIDAVFGSRSREEMLAFIGACDFLIIPSLAEGFCLPLLEANAMGVPVLHSLYPPLTEISDVKNNLVFEYDELKIADIGEGIEYELHVYNPNTLAEMMDYAIDMIKNNHDEYLKRRKKLVEVIKRFNGEALYSKLLKHVGV